MSVTTSAKACELANVRQLHSDMTAKFVQSTPARTRAAVRRPRRASTAEAFRLGAAPALAAKASAVMSRPPGPLYLRDYRYTAFRLPFRRWIPPLEGRHRPPECGWGG